jgi:hypothetical protein
VSLDRRRFWSGWPGTLAAAFAYGFLAMVGGNAAMPIGSVPAQASTSSPVEPGPWLPISDWARCRELAKPGLIAELRNAEGQSLFTPCTDEVPPVPFDWASPVEKFRMIVEPTPTHSTPLPEPKG